MEQQNQDSPPPPGEANVSRRGFLGFLTVSLGAVPILGGLFVAIRSGLAPAFSSKPEKIPLCTLDEVPADGIKTVAVSYEMRQGPRRESIGKTVFVTRDPEDDEKVIAMLGECTHLSCPVQAKPMQIDGSNEEAPLTCPCHGGMFSRTGEVKGGPPERPLRRLKVEQADDGQIFLLET